MDFGEHVWGLAIPANLRAAMRLDPRAARPQLESPFRASAAMGKEEIGQSSTPKRFPVRATEWIGERSFRVQRLPGNCRTSLKRRFHGNRIYSIMSPSFRRRDLRKRERGWDAFSSLIALTEPNPELRCGRGVQAAMEIHDQGR